VKSQLFVYKCSTAMRDVIDPCSSARSLPERTVNGHCIVGIWSSGAGSLSTVNPDPFDRPQAPVPRVPPDRRGHVVPLESSNGREVSPERHPRTQWSHQEALATLYFPGQMW